jgi:hypothetical protein
MDQKWGASCQNWTTDPPLRRISEQDQALKLAYYCFKKWTAAKLRS